MKRKNAIKSEAEIRAEVRNELPKGLILTLGIFSVLLWPLPLISILSGANFIFQALLLYVGGWWAFFLFVCVAANIEKYGLIPDRRKAEMEAEVQRRLASQQERVARLQADEADERDGAEVYALDNYEARGMRLGDDGELTDAGFDDEEQLRAATIKQQRQRPLPPAFSPRRLTM